MTKSIKEAVIETNRRRKRQIEFNLENRIEPKSISKPIPQKNSDISNLEVNLKTMTRNDLIELSTKIETQMNKFAEELEFEKAIEHRQQLKKVNEILLKLDN